MLRRGRNPTLAFVAILKQAFTPLIYCQICSLEGPQKEGGKFRSSERKKCNKSFSPMCALLGYVQC